MSQSQLVTFRCHMIPLSRAKSLSKENTFMLMTSLMANCTKVNEFSVLVEVTLLKISPFRYFHTVECSILNLIQCWKFGAEYAHITHRSPTQLAYPDWPKEVLERPILTNIEGNTVTFRDGTTGEYDVIIKCTGYLHSFPFLPKGNIRFNL